MKSLLIWIVIAAIGYGFYSSKQADRDEDGSITGSGSIDAFQIRVGDCFDDNEAILSDTTDISDVPGVPCSQPHDNEVYAVFDTHLTTFPGDEEMFNLSFEACLERFMAFVNLDYESSSLDILTMYPNQQSWNQDDREIVCAVYDLEFNKLTGSMKGSGI